MNKYKNRLIIQGLVNDLSNNFSVYRRPVRQTANDATIIPKQSTMDDLEKRISKTLPSL